MLGGARVWGNKTAERGYTRCGDHRHLRREWRHLGPRGAAEDRSLGPGTRVPTIIVSPFAKRHFVDHTTYDTTSILKLIEARWGLTPLGVRDAHAADLTNALQLK
jgi:phospholipase C